LNEKEKQNALNEIRLMASLNHPNVIGYRDSFWDNNSGSLCIIMEYCNAGDLYQKILKHQNEKTSFKEKEIWNILI